MKLMNLSTRSFIIHASISLGLLCGYAHAQPFSMAGFGSAVFSTDSLITKNTLFILTSEKSCTGCKDNLGSYLTGMQADTARYDIVIVSQVRTNSPLLKRELYNEMKACYPMASKVYFDACADSASIFNHFNVKPTPTLVFYNKSTESWNLAAYPAIFNGIYLSPWIKQELAAFFTGAN